MEKAGRATQLSAVLLAWELQLLAVPMTALSVFALAWLWGPAFHPGHVPLRAAVVVGLIGLVGFWRLVLGFYRAGLRLDACRFPRLDDALHLIRRGAFNLLRQPV